MRHTVVVLLLVLCTGLALGLAVDTTASAAGRSAPAATSTRTVAKPAPDHYVVTNGVTFNEPYGRDGHRRYAIRDKIVRSIRSTVRGDHILISSWNIRGRTYADALINAHRRGVSVRIVMDHGNANRNSPNPDVNRIIKALKHQNRIYANRSGFVRCNGSCRGAHGIAHSKFFLFDHVGKKRWITMFTSNNATDVAATSQWNDLFTVVNNKSMFEKFSTIWHQMAQDHNLGQRAYSHWRRNDLAVDFYPNTGNANSDPDLHRLHQIVCRGATGGTGTHGRTKVRIAQDALTGQRGINIAHRLVQMKRRGCDVRLVFSLLGGNARKILKAGHVPMLQYSYDRNRDGMYDIYLHMKVMAISGRFRGRTDARVVFNGTANWTSVALASDEVVGQVEKASTTRAYINWIDYLFHHRPARWGPTNLARVTSIPDRPIVGRDGRVIVPRGTRIDPYAIMRRDDL